MVFVITATAESDRNTVGRLLADDLGWEFIDGENLHLPVGADPSFRIETLLPAVNYWIYKWQDVVVSCPALTEADRRQVREISPLVKIVCLEAWATGVLPLLDRDCPGHVAGSNSPDVGRAKYEPRPERSTVSPTRQVEEIVRTIVSNPKQRISF